MMTKVAGFLRFSALCALASLSLAFPGGARAADETGFEILEVERVWDEAAHNAFTDLRRFNGRWFLVFREGHVHGVPKPGEPPGKIRVLTSPDGREWASAAVLSWVEDQDLRDPKLSETPDGELMLVAAARPHAEPERVQSLVWFSRDGVEWKGLDRIGEVGWWLWRVSWSEDGNAYGIGYGPVREALRRSRLYRSEDGRDFEVLVEELPIEPEKGSRGGGEGTIRFLPDGTAIALIRQDPAGGRVGAASPPYTDWHFKDTGVRIGGPNLIQLPNGALLAAGRLYPPRTSLCLLDPENGTLEEVVELPSGGDCSYPGLVFHEGDLWVSYYSSHEGRAAIYVARARMPTETLKR